MTRADFIRQQREARETMEQLAKLFPGCFHPNGKPIVASAHFPTLRELNAPAKPTEAAAMSEQPTLLPCPFCGGPAKLEEARTTRDRYMGERRWWGVICRNTLNIGGSCCMAQVPSASIEAAVGRWNMRNGKHPEPRTPDPTPTKS